MMRACGRCGKIHPYNFKCDKGRIYNESMERDLRNKYAWAQKSAEIRERAQGLCEVCRAQGIYTYKALEVHHIEKLRDNPQGLLDDYNLVCLCTAHHKQADAGEIPQDYLRELAQKREHSHGIG